MVMKNHKLNLLLGIFVLIPILFTFCKKSKDFRENYCGDYSFSVKRYIKPDPGSPLDTTWTYNGSITKDPSKSEGLFIYYGLGASTEGNLHEDNSIDKGAYPGLGWGVNGKFDGNFNLKFIWSGNFTDSVTARKK